MAPGRARTMRGATGARTGSPCETRILGLPFCTMIDPTGPVVPMPVPKDWVPDRNHWAPPDAPAREKHRP